jgi:iron complex transport system ATP-binding protein
MLVAANLTLAYGQQVVVEDVSFEIPQGQFVAVLGPNGSGKSTLLRALCRLHKPRAGTVILAGRDLRDWGPRELAQQMALVRQSPMAAFDFTVEELVMLGRMPYLRRFQTETEQDYAVVRHYLCLTGLWPMRQRGLHSLSGGELQRAFVCQALVQEPKLLLLDEPTNHLDINHQLELLDLVASLNRKQRITVVAVLHDLNLAALYAERLLVLKAGRLVADGSPSDVLHPDLVQQTYGCSVSVLTHPVSQRPQVLLLPQTTSQEDALS